MSAYGMFPLSSRTSDLVAHVRNGTGLLLNWLVGRLGDGVGII